MKHQSNGCFGVRTLLSWDYRYSINYIRFFLFFFKQTKGVHFFWDKNQTKTEWWLRKRWSKLCAKIACMNNCLSCVKTFLVMDGPLYFQRMSGNFLKYIFSTVKTERIVSDLSTCFSCPTSLCTFLPRPDGPLLNARDHVLTGILRQVTKIWRWQIYY